MDGKTSEWRPGPTVCRCCLTEGCYKDISTEYFWMGKREVYSEMLSETFNVSIAYSQSGGPNSNSRLICEPCISKLRDASEFKRQVQECEKTFIQHLDPGTSVVLDVETAQEQPDKSVKLERVKLEKHYSDDDIGGNDFAGGGDADDADEDDDDDLDDQPLTKFVSKVPKKESVDILDLLDNSQLTVKRKSKTKAPPAKKVKLAKKETPVKATASKPVTKPVEKKKKEQNPMYMAKQNAKMIVQYTTAYPFRLPESTMVCVYCCENYPDPNEFRKHMEDAHKHFKVTPAFAHIHEGYIKVDCTDLRCRICNKKFEEVKDAAVHIKTVHGKNVNFDYDIGLQPFKVKTDMLLCGVCDYKAPNICSVSRHLQKHFLQCTCETCGKSYATATSLSYHIKYGCRRVTKQRNCRKCKQIFETPEQLRVHREKSKICCPYICNTCGCRFENWRIKQEHMEKAHGMPKKKYPCIECGMVFSKPDSLRNHFKTLHTTDHWVCACCGRKFDRENALNVHMTVHTGEKSFTCSICSKSFSRKSALNQHMWIHSEVKKHECKMCDKQFNQRVSWKTHMKSRHPELCDF